MVRPILLAVPSVISNIGQTLRLGYPIATRIKGLTGLGAINRVLPCAASQSPHARLSPSFACILTVSSHSPLWDPRPGAALSLPSRRTVALCSRVLAKPEVTLYASLPAPLAGVSLPTSPTGTADNAVRVPSLAEYQ